MRPMQIHPKETSIKSTFVVNEGNEISRVFPFQATPSGNLKIIPNQVRKNLVLTDAILKFFQKYRSRSRHSIVVLGCIRVEEI